VIQLVYVSSAVTPFTNEELVALLEKARSNNEALGITGMLLYKNGDFMQALEGEEQHVVALAGHIAKDPRHTDVRVILQAPTKLREFPDWTMGFHNLNDIDPQELPGYSTFLNSPLRSQAFTSNPAFCRRLLLLFKTKPQRVVVNTR
jgi:hypothetical protein